VCSRSRQPWCRGDECVSGSATLAEAGSSSRLWAVACQACAPAPYTARCLRPGTCRGECLQRRGSPSMRLQIAKPRPRCSFERTCKSTISVTWGAVGVGVCGPGGRGFESRRSPSTGLRDLPVLAVGCSTSGCLWSRRSFRRPRRRGLDEDRKVTNGARSFPRKNRDARSGPPASRLISWLLVDRGSGRELRPSGRVSGGGVPFAWAENGGLGRDCIVLGYALINFAILIGLVRWAIF
jgi:hypothetical protein